MPFKTEKDIESSGNANILFMAPAKSGKTCTAVLTAPRPIFILNSDPDGLVGPRKLGAKFEYEDCYDYASLKKHWESLKKETGGKNGIRTVIIDSFTFLARALLAELENNGAKGFELYNELERRVVGSLTNYMRLPAHKIIIAHAINGSNNAGDLGIMPAVKGVAKTIVPAMCQDMLWMEVVAEKGKEPRREFLLGPEGDWTHGMRSLHGGGRMEADFGALFKKMGLK